MVRNILEYLEYSAVHYGEKEAFVDEESSLTFSQLLDLAQGIGTALLQCISKGEPVAVYMRKSVQQIAAFFGVVSAGGFYVPIDVTMPEQRVRLILETLEAKVLIADRDIQSIAQSLGFGGQVLLYDDLASTIPCLGELKEIRQSAIDGDPLYAIFTSGSSGIPKGVLISQRSAINFTEWYCNAFHHDETVVFGNQTPFYFDASVKQIYATIRCGCTMYIIPKKLFSFPVQLVDYLNLNRINCIDWVPSALCMIVNFDTFKKVKPQYLKKVIFGAEVMPTKQFNLWRKALPGILYGNTYGPTEVTVDCCYYIVDRDLRDEEPIPIGRACENTEVLIFDEQNQLVTSPGDIGELCVRGVSLALGYYNDPEKTDAVFVQNPLQKHYRELIYRTGDLAKINEYGEIMICGRKDSQIKHMGHRIELGEIETAIAALPEIRRVCCLYNANYDKIVAIYEGKLDRKAIVDGIKNRIPKYMWPNTFIQLEELPMNLNGKIDRVKLKEEYINA